jgi:hypothetical protein
MKSTDSERGDFIKALHSFFWAVRDMLVVIPKWNYTQHMMLDKVPRLVPLWAKGVFEEFSPSSERCLDF